MYGSFVVSETFRQEAIHGIWYIYDPDWEDLWGKQERWGVGKIGENKSNQVEKITWKLQRIQRLQSLVGFRNQVSSLCLLQLFVVYHEARYERKRRQRGGESFRSLQMHFQLLAKTHMSHPAPFSPFLPQGSSHCFGFICSWSYS